eukprot:2366355-Rhodomonas_salina.2
MKVAAAGDETQLALIDAAWRIHERWNPAMGEMGTKDQRQCSARGLLAQTIGAAQKHIIPTSSSDPSNQKSDTMVLHRRLSMEVSVQSMQCSLTEIGNILVSSEPVLMICRR